MRWLIFSMTLAALAGCTASSAMKPYIGKDVSELSIDWGKPTNRFDLPDGRVAVQYMWGGGTFATPATMSGTTTMIGNTIYTNAQAMPSTVIHSEGCLVTFMLRRNGSSWTVDDIRYPSAAIC